MKIEILIPWRLGKLKQAKKLLMLDARHSIVIGYFNNHKYAFCRESTDILTNKVGCKDKDIPPGAEISFLPKELLYKI